MTFTMEYSYSVPVFFRPIRKGCMSKKVVDGLPAFTLDSRRDQKCRGLLYFAFSGNASDTGSALRGKGSGGGACRTALRRCFSGLISSIVSDTIAVRAGLRRSLRIVRVDSLYLGAISFSGVGTDSVRGVLGSKHLTTGSFFSSRVRGIGPAGGFQQLFTARPRTLGRMIHASLRLDSRILVDLESAQCICGLCPALLA